MVEINNELKPLEPASEKKTGRKSKALLIVCSAAAVIAVAVLLVLLVPSLKNKVCMMFLPEKLYYTNAEKAYSADVASMIGDLYTTACVMQNSENSTDNSECTTLIMNFDGNNIASFLETDPFLPEELELKLTSILQNGASLIYNSNVFSMNKTNFFSLESCFDTANGEYYFGMPYLTDSYVSMSKDKASEIVYGKEKTEGDVRDNSEKVNFWDGERLSEEALNRMFERYNAIWFSYVNNVAVTELNKDYCVSTGTSTADVARMKIVFTAQQHKALVTELCDSMRTDKDLFDFARSGAMSEREYENIISFMENAYSDVPDTACFEYRIFIDRSGKICGKTIAVTEKGIITREKSWSLVGDGKGNFSLEAFTVTEDGVCVGFEADGAADSNLVCHGTADFYYGESKVRNKAAITFDSVDLKRLKKGQIAGNAYIFGDEISAALNVNFDTENRTENAHIEFTAEDMKLFTADFSMAKINGVEYTVPTENIYSMDDENTDWKEYAESFDFADMRYAVKDVFGSVAGEDSIDEFFDIIDEGFVELFEEKDY